MVRVDARIRRTYDAGSSGHARTTALRLVVASRWKYQGGTHMRPRSLIALSVTVFVASMGIAALHADQPDGDASRIQIGYAYAKDQGIPLDVQGRNRASIGLGSYLVNAVGVCNECHTWPSYTQNPFLFLGAPKQVNVPCYMAGGRPFGPGVVSRDITPWEDGKPAGLTAEEFLHVMRTGEDPDDPGQVLQVMPWPVYQSMSDRDLLAIYDYLTAIPAINAYVCGVPSEP